jgi:hypothetical protein
LEIEIHPSRERIAEKKDPTSDNLTRLPGDLLSLRNLEEGVNENILTTTMHLLLFAIPVVIVLHTLVVAAHPLDSYCTIDPMF